MRTFKKGLGLKVGSFEEVDYCLLELFSHFGTKSILDYANSVIVVLHSENEVANPIYFCAIRFYLELSNHGQDSISYGAILQGVVYMVG